MNPFSLPPSLSQRFLATGALLATFLPAALSGAPTVLGLNESSAIDGQQSWTYTAGTGVRSSEVTGEPGGLFHVASDGGILAASPRHFYTRAGLDGNPKMNNWLARPVNLEGTTYVRFLVRLESRDAGTFGTDPYEFFFGFAPGVASGGFPPSYAALKIPFSGGEAGVETAGPDGAMFYPDAGVSLNDTIFVVARFNVNASGNLTGIDVWLDPESGDGDTPDHSTVFAEPGPLVVGAPDGVILGNASFRYRSQNMPSRLDNLALGSSWADVVPAAYTGTTPRPPVVLAAPNDVVGFVGDIWTARVATVESAAAAAAVTRGERETVAIYLVDAGAPITGYQWLLNNTVNIPGGNAQQFTFMLNPTTAVGTPVRLALGATIKVRAASASGNVETANARLSEVPSTEITGQPSDRLILEGDRATFSVTVESPVNLTYQWFGPAGEIDGANNRILSFRPAQVSDSGEYYVVVKDELGGEIESSRATLTVAEFSIPEDARVLRLFPSAALGDNIEFDGIEDTQVGPELSPHASGTEPPTIPSIPRGLFNALIGQAYQAGRGGVFDFSLDTAELVSGTPKPTGPEQPFLPFDYPVLRDGSNNLVRDQDGNLQFNTAAEPNPTLGYIGEFLLKIGDRDLRVVPNVRNSGGFGDGYAGRESAFPNYLEATGLYPHPNNFLVTDPYPLASINQHSPTGAGQIASSPPHLLSASSFIELAFDPDDLIDLAGFVFINRNYFQSHRTSKPFPGKPNIRATATFSNGEDRIDLISTGFTFQGDDGPGLGQNTFFGFQSPEAGYYLERIEVYALGNNFRLLFDIDDLAVAVEGEVGELPPVVQTEPQDKLVYPGETVTFSVEVDSESDVTYAWFFGETQLGDTGDSLTLTNVSSADEGQYWVRLTNEAGTSESRRASLAIRPLPTFSLESASVPSQGGTLEVDVNVPSGITWTLQPTAGWISVIDAGLGSGTDRIRLSFAANSSVDERSGALNLLIQVAGSPTALATLPITQEGAPVFFDVFPESFNVGAAGGQAFLEIIGTDGAEWSFDPEVDWIFAPDGMSGEGTADVALVISANLTFTARSVVFELEGTGFTITVTQAGRVPADIFPGAAPTTTEGTFDLSASWLGAGVLLTDLPGLENDFIYTDSHGWWASFVLEDGLWLYDFGLELWYFTGEDYFPWFFADLGIGWMYYATETADPRFFWVYSLEEWIEESLLLPNPAPAD